VAGHYNNFGTKYPLPAKRAERALKARARLRGADARCDADSALLGCTRLHSCTLLTLLARFVPAQELSDAELLIQRGR
jgi:hypothetical protein